MSNPQNLKSGIGRMVVAIFVSVVLSSCATILISEATRKLSPGISESEVISRLGAQPDVVNLSTCGQSTTAGAWTCKVYKYNGPGSDELRIIFEQWPDGIWHVASWQAY